MAGVHFGGTYRVQLQTPDGRPLPAETGTKVLHMMKEERADRNADYFSQLNRVYWVENDERGDHGDRFETRKQDVMDKLNVWAENRFRYNPDSDKPNWVQKLLAKMSGVLPAAIEVGNNAKEAVLEMFEMHRLYLGFATEATPMTVVVSEKDNRLTYETVKD